MRIVRNFKRESQVRESTHGKTNEEGQGEGWGGRLIKLDEGHGRPPSTEAGRMHPTSPGPSLYTQTGFSGLSHDGNHDDAMDALNHVM